MERCSAADRHLVAIYVEYFPGIIPGDACNHGKVPICGEYFEQARIRAHRLSHLPQLRVKNLRIDESSIESAQANRTMSCSAERRHQIGVDATSEYLHHGIDHAGVGNAQTIDKRAFYASFGEEARHLLAASVDHDDSPLRVRCERNFTRQTQPRFLLIEKCSAQLDEDLLHAYSSPSVS